jgi:phenylpropionate dioxygenase-like ring-hydroxylating dioxygenase large terminal subunit
MRRPTDPFDPHHFDGVRRPVAECETPPPWVYTSQAFYEREVERIFRRGWCCVGRANDLVAGAPAYRELVGTHLVLERGADGRIAIADDRGRAVRMGERGGFLFVNLDGEGASLDMWLGGWGPFFDTYKLQDMVTVRRHEADLRANWKLATEVFIEEYHAPTVHTNTLYKRPLFMKAYDPAPGAYATVFGAHEGSRALIAGNGHKPFPPIANLEGQAKAGTRWTVTYTGFCFVVTIDAMWYIECYPKRPDLTHYAWVNCFPRETAARADYDAIAPGYYQRWDLAVAEDNVVLERQQRGLSSPFARAGRVQPRKEPIMAHLHKWVAERVIGNAGPA